MYRIEIDRSLCSGFGSCAQLAPHSIRLGRDGIAEPIHHVGEDPDVLEAAASCPMGAILVYDEQGAQAA
jgi:ferredoxin